MRPRWLALAVSLGLHGVLVGGALVVVTGDESLPPLTIDLRDDVTANPELAPRAASARGDVAMGRSEKSRKGGPATRADTPRPAPSPRPGASPEPGAEPRSSPPPKPSPPAGSDAATPTAPAAPPATVAPAPSPPPPDVPAAVPSPAPRVDAPPAPPGRPLAPTPTSEWPSSASGPAVSSDPSRPTRAELDPRRGEVGHAIGGDGTGGGTPVVFDSGAGAPSTGRSAGTSASGSMVASLPPGSGAALGAEYGPYLTTLRQRIQQAMRYPATARRRGLGGTVSVEILIQADGVIAHVALIESSSHDVLDAAALDAIRSLPRLPLPPELPRRALRVRVPVVFDLGRR